MLLRNTLKFAKIQFIFIFSPKTNHSTTDYIKQQVMRISYAVLFCILALVAQSKLVYMAELFRHGARYTTSELYDGNQTKNMSGNLTAVGMRQQYLLGSYLRQDYLQELGLRSQFDPTQVQVFTESSSLRCIESAYAHMSGWFPLGQGEQLPSGIDQQLLKPPFTPLSMHLQVQEPALQEAYQPIPIKSGSSSAFPKCQQLQEIIVKRVETVADKIAILQSQHQIFANRMRNIFKIPLIYDNLAGLIELYDVVAADRNLGRKLPTEFTEEEFKQLKFVQNYFLILVYAGELAKVVSTPIAKTVIENMQQIIGGKYGDKKLTVFSGHDTNVAPMLSFLNLSDAECVQRKYRNQTVSGNCGQPVPFASSIQFQLHQSSQQADLEGDRASSYFVKVKYNGQYYKLCNSSSNQCDFPQFEARVRASLIDYNKVCGNA